MAGEVEDYIRRAAAQRGIDPDVAVRVAQSEGGTTEYARRGTFKTGSSWWPFQLHYGGKGYEQLGNVAGMGNTFTAQTGWQPGDPTAWRAATDFALDQARQSGWGQWYGARNIGITGFTGIDRAAQTAPRTLQEAQPEANAPEWYRDIVGARDLAFRYGRDEGPGVQPIPNAPPEDAGPPDWYRELLSTGSVGATPSASSSAGGLVWPVAGQSRDSARINNPFGAPQVRSAGFAGSLPAANYGVDVNARLGDPVVAPAPGVVSQVLTTGGPNYGYGNSVTVDLGGGREVQLSHFRDAPAVRPGQRVSPGDLLGYAGMTGNATGVHVDAAAREQGKPVDFLRWYDAPGAAGARAAAPSSARQGDPDWYRELMGGR